MTKIDLSKLKRIDTSSFAHPKPKDKPTNTSIKPKKKGLKKSKLQKKKDTPNSGYWKKKADKAWGQHMHHHFRECLVGNVLGGCKGQLEAHHILSRSKLLTRHDPDNGVILCSLHHKFSRECSPHMAPIQFTEFLREHYPHKIEYAIKNTHQIGKPNFKQAYEDLTSEME